MIELIDAKAFAIENGGIDAVEVASDYNGSAVYKFIPFDGHEGLKLGPPILFTIRNSTFSFMTSDEVDEFLSWQVKDVYYEDD